jgi:2-amino-4-hydroxy-6-hydroxymethyldihydropteridine diphosphokinase
VILIAIGGNLPGPQGAVPLLACRAAAEALRGLPGLRFAGLSRWYETAPVPPSGQPNYINGIARLEGDADPAWLLARLHRIERMAGRQRGAANAARTLDLDLIDLNGLVRVAPDPVLPHPRAHARGFVLVPLADVAPDWEHPTLGASVANLIAALPPQGIRPL